MRKLVLLLVALLLMFSGVCLSQESFISPKLMDEKLASLNEYENRRFMEIIVLVAKDSTMPKPSTRMEFGELLNKMQLSNDQREGLKNTLIASNIYMIHYWRDAMKSLELGRPYLSKSRLNLESEMLDKGLLNKERQAENNAILKKIASRMPIEIEAGLPEETEKGMAVFDKELIGMSLSNAEASIERFNRLFSED